MSDAINVDLVIKLFDQLKESHEKMSSQIEKLSGFLSTYISSESKPTKQELKELITKNKGEYIERLKVLEATSEKIKEQLKEITDVIGINEDILFHHIDNIGKINDTRDEVAKLVCYIENLKKMEYSERDIEEIGGFVKKLNEVFAFIKAIKSRTTMIIGSIGLITSLYGIIKVFEALIKYFGG